VAAKTNNADVLGSLPLFSGLSKGELKHIAAEAREELYSPGQDIVTQGQSGGPFFCITEGRVDVVRDGKKVGEQGPGSAFGERSLFEGGPRTATIRAQTHVKALAIASWNFLAILEDNWDLTKKILAELSRRLSEAEGSH
jgi:CRP/FNR family transcriptional regulator, cyclic AMP receptor protein